MATNPQKALESKVRKHRRELDTVSSNLSRHKRATESELAAIRRELVSLRSRDLKASRMIRELELEVPRMRDLKNSVIEVNRKILALESAWNPKILQRMVGGMESFSKALGGLERRSSSTLKNLERTNAGMVAISQHARDIESERTDAKFAARELADKAENLNETVQNFFKQTDALNSRLNSNMTVLNEITSTIELLKNKIDSMEQQINNVNQLKSLMEENSRHLSELSGRIGYVEKVSTKTVVIE